MIGASELSQLAARLESAADGGREAEIDGSHAELLGRYGAVTDAIRALSNVTAVLSDGITNESIFINTARVPDARIRKALLLGMDRQTVFDGLLYGNGEIVDGFLVSASPCFSEELGVTAYDPAAAKALVDEARADGAKTDYTWYVNSSETAWISAVEYFKEAYQEIGLNIEIRTVVFDSLMEVAGNLEHDIMSVEYSYAPVDPYTDVVWLLGGEGSWTGFASDETNEALALSQTLDDEKEIARQYLIVDRVMQEQAPMISGWVIAKLGAVNNRLVNAHPNIFGTFVNVQEWDVQ
jgi:peptide/nickel transport system substrate-binding protein